MAVYVTRTQTLADIGNAIRLQNGGSVRYRPADMPAAIAALDGSKTDLRRDL